MKIGKFETKTDVFLAPMAGVTDVAFRELCRQCGAGLTTTEMVSVKGLYYNSKNTKKLLQLSPLESPSVVQLFGHEPKVFEEVLNSGVLDNFDIIDINMGCPAPKIVKNGDGSALLKNIELARQIIETCVKFGNRPVTVKFRKGFGENDDVLIPFAKMCEEAGASAITIHPRTTFQGYSGKIDLEDIAKVKRAVNIPVVGNGDVRTYEDFFDMKKTGCDGVLIGRGAVGHPEIFSICSGDILKKNSIEIAKEHIDIMKKYFDKDYIQKNFKRHAFGYVDGESGAVEKRKKIAVAKSVEEIEQILFDEK